MHRHKWVVVSKERQPSQAELLVQPGFKGDRNTKLGWLEEYRIGIQRYLDGE